MKKFLIFFVILGVICNVSGQFSYDFSDQSDFDDNFGNLTYTYGAGASGDADYNVTTDGYLWVYAEEFDDTDQSNDMRSHFWHDTALDSDQFEVTWDLVNWTGDDERVGLWQSSMRTDTPNIRPRPFSVRISGGCSDGQCCLWITNDSQDFEAYKISSSDCVRSRSCTVKLKKSANDTSIDVYVNCSGSQSFSYTNTNTYHYSMFDGEDVYAGGHVYKWYGGGSGTYCPGGTCYFHNSYGYLIDNMNYTTDSSDLVSCDVEYDSIVRGNEQKLSMEVSGGTPDEAYFLVDGAQYEPETLIEGSPDTYEYDWYIDNETLGEHNVTCYIESNEENDTMDVSFFHNNATVSVNVFDILGNGISSQAVSMSQNNTHIENQSTGLYGTADFSVKGDRDYQYVFYSADDDGNSATESVTVVNDTTINLTLAVTFGTFNVNTYIDGAGYCGGILSEITFDNIASDYSKTVTGTTCDEGIGKTSVSLEAGTYEISWLQNGVDTQADVTRTINTGGNETVNLFGTLGGDDTIPDPGGTYSSDIFNIYVYDQDTGAGLSNATVYVYECSPFGGVSCNNLEGVYTTNGSGYLHLYLRHENFWGFVVDDGGYMREPASGARIVNTLYEGVEEGCCGNVNLNVTLYFMLKSMGESKHTIHVTDCSDSSDIENVTITCNDQLGNVQVQLTDSSGNAEFTLPDHTYECVLDHDEYFRSDQRVDMIWGATTEICLSEIYTNNTLYGYVLNDDGEGINGARVDVECVDDAFYPVTVFSDTRFCDSDGYYNFTNVPYGKRCGVKASRFNYVTDRQTITMNSSYELNFTLENSTNEFRIDVKVISETREDGGGGHNIRDAKVKMRVYENAFCTNASSETIDYTDDQGVVSFEFVGESIAYFFNLEIEAYNYRTERTPCSKVEDSTYKLIVLSRDDDLANHVKFSGTQLCDGHLYPLNNFFVNVHYADWTVAYNHEYVDSFSKTLIMPDGKYNFRFTKTHEGFDKELETMTKKIYKDEDIVFHTDLCFGVMGDNDINASEEVELDVKERQALNDVEDLVWTFLPILIMLFIFNIISKSTK